MYRKQIHGVLYQSEANAPKTLNGKLNDAKTIGYKT